MINVIAKLGCFSRVVAISTWNNSIVNYETEHLVVICYFTSETV